MAEIKLIFKDETDAHNWMLCAMADMPLLLAEATKRAKIIGPTFTCRICRQTLSIEHDCGGDCTWCMADAGDPDCIKWVEQFGPKPSSDNDQTQA